MTARKSIRVAIAQPYTKLGDVQGNLAQVLDLASEAAASRCDIVLYPEVALHGYSIPPHVLAAAITDDGPEVAALLDQGPHITVPYGWRHLEVVDRSVKTEVVFLLQPAFVFIHVHSSVRISFTTERDVGRSRSGP